MTQEAPLNIMNMKPNPTTNYENNKKYYENETKHVKNMMKMAQNPFRHENLHKST